MTELITPPGVPVAAGPYSPGLLTGDWIFLSGQGGFDPETGELVSDNITDQTAQVSRNIEVLLRAAGAERTESAAGVADVAAPDAKPGTSTAVSACAVHPAVSGSLNQRQDLLPHFRGPHAHRAYIYATCTLTP